MTKQERIQVLQNQIGIAKMYASYWQAMATTGAAKLRNISRGREPTEQERKNGIVMPMQELTGPEKVQDALNMSLTHIHRMNDLNDLIMEATT